MKSQIAVFLSVATLFINNAAAQCDKLPAEFNPEVKFAIAIASGRGCCKFPVMDGVEESIKKALDQTKDQKLDEYMSECRVSEEVFKDLKLIKDKTIDKDAFAKHMDDKVKDASWKPVMKAAADQCVKEVTEKKVEILNELAKEPFNIKPDQCNGIYMSLVTCIHLVGFGNCPKESWTEEKRCVDAKAWLSKCGENIDSMKQLAEKKSKK